MTTGWPSRGLNASPMMRDTTSPLPPAAKPWVSSTAGWDRRLARHRACRPRRARAGPCRRCRRSIVLNGPWLSLGLRLLTLPSATRSCRGRGNGDDDADALSLLELGLLAEGAHVSGREGRRMAEPPRRHLQVRELRALVHQAQSQGGGADARPRR